jgi:hypothetical protein|uniref:Uncharacterized protein n=1 Tax=Siphoviridae sp. ctWf32 TaxID=2827884 RepID=A0A8S5SUB5_9CAUD|nr:MAG TPA: hypothetical protein [Siphoviridae sp. ctWf32]
MTAATSTASLRILPTRQTPTTDDRSETREEVRVAYQFGEAVDYDPLAAPPSFWKMRPETMGIIAGALLMERRDALWPRLLMPLCSIVRDADALPDKEALWLFDWMKATGRPTVPFDDFQVVQISREWVAGLLDGRDTTANRAISGLVEIGLLTPVHRGVKGHASLYVVNPPPPIPPL